MYEGFFVSHATLNDHIRWQQQKKYEYDVVRWHVRRGGQRGEAADRDKWLRLVSTANPPARPPQHSSRPYIIIYSEEGKNKELCIY